MTMRMGWALRLSTVISQDRLELALARDHVGLVVVAVQFAAHLDGGVRSEGQAECVGGEVEGEGAFAHEIVFEIDAGVGR